MNYQSELEKILAKDSELGKKVLLHSCCAPCSSYVLTYLRQYFRVTVFYFNPNITADTEYYKRVEEQKRLIEALNEEKSGYKIDIIEGDYQPESFLELVKGYELCPEGGERCKLCFRQRLEVTASLAKSQGFDYFATTLTVSPLKNATVLNELGLALAEEYDVSYLVSDFKKKNGYKTSIELSKKYDLYRQDYCGCAFSKAERELQKQKNAE
ncbi:MAG: epoxyqueuosine reductase QueH [Lachnospiraceae bacterium]|nr:epoxyqueuosine reductase QueH [Lachnospiraceae bacterium]